MGLEELKRILASYQRLAVALSGGVDSSVLLYLAREVLGASNVLALTVRSPIFPPEDLALAAETAWRLGIKILGVSIAHLSLPKFVKNPPDRCYHCKRAMYERLLKTARRHGFSVLADGTHADDLMEDRPGLFAIRELRVVTPLAEAGLPKTTIRQIAQHAGLRTAMKPPTPCLATRFPFGEPLTTEDLARVLKGERLLRALGFQIFRLRSKKREAWLEIPAEEEETFRRERFFLLKELKELGFEKLGLKIR